MMKELSNEQLPDYLQIQPRKFTFHPKSSKTVQDIRIVNTSNQTIACKVKLTNRESYSVSPTQFVVEPRATRICKIALTQVDEDTLAAQPRKKDKFLIQSRAVRPDSTDADLGHMWKQLEKLHKPKEDMYAYSTQQLSANIVLAGELPGPAEDTPAPLPPETKTLPMAEYEQLLEKGKEYEHAMKQLLEYSNEITRLQKSTERLKQQLAEERLGSEKLKQALQSTQKEQALQAADSVQSSFDAAAPALENVDQLLEEWAQDTPAGAGSGAGAQEDARHGSGRAAGSTGRGSSMLFLQGPLQIALFALLFLALGWLLKK